jgi:hypothetical protein
VRTQPAVSFVIGDAPLPTTKIGHDVFDLAAAQALGNMLGRLTDELVAVAERKRKPDTRPMFGVFE